MTGPPHQGDDHPLQFSLSPEHPIVADSLVLGGIGLQLRAIKERMAQVHNPGLLAEAQDVNEEAVKGINIPTSRINDPAAVTKLVALGTREARSW